MRVGMVGARFAGLDGVSLESAKIAEALRRGGHEIAWFAGEVGEDFAPSVECPPASFDTSENAEIQYAAFRSGNPVSTTATIEQVTRAIRPSLETFLERFAVEAVVVENAWAIPMQLPLAVAVARTIDESGIATVGHHHDFAWERPRFSECAMPEVLEQYFPPTLENVSHVVINSLAQTELKSRRGLDSLVLPNVMDFEAELHDGDGGAAFRLTAGIGASDTVLLQPTRVIPRKGIERTLELAAAVSGNPKVVVTHPDDLDSAYWRSLVNLAVELDVDIRLVDVGRDMSALTSAYEAADIVCFPSSYEGYGNALVEAVYHRKPVMVNRYSVYRSDIEPLGFEFIEIDGAITSAVVDAVNTAIAGGAAQAGAAERNFAIGRSNLSYSRGLSVMEQSLAVAQARG